MENVNEDEKKWKRRGENEEKNEQGKEENEKCKRKRTVKKS